MRTALIGVALGALLTSFPVHAETDEEIAARYGIRQTVLDISLSPSGTKVAFISPGAEHTELLKIVDLTGEPTVNIIASNTEQIGDLSRCQWATDVRLVCEITGIGQGGGNTLIPFSRMFSINYDGSDVQQLSQRRSSRALGFTQDGGSIVAMDVKGESGRILLTREYVKEFSTGTRLANDKSGLGVDEINVENGRRKAKVQPDAMASGYVADQEGRVRLKVRSIRGADGLLTGERIYNFRTADSNRWRVMDNVTIDGAARREFYPVAIDSQKEAAIGYDTIDGFDVLVEVPLNDTGQGRVLLARDDVDVDSLIRIGRQRRVVGASFATEKRSIKYFDPELDKLAAALGKALPNQPLVNIVGASADESRLLIIASSDTDPGTVYLYDKATRNLEQLLAMREYLVNQQMGQMKPVTFPASDGTQIPGYLTLPPGSEGKNLSAIVLPHGGPAARDEWGFDWLVQFFTARGYAVLQPNYRGSSGYGEAWFGRNGYQSWDTAIGDVNDAGRWLISEGIANPDKLAIVGWSYGGYAALQSQVVDPTLYKAVAAIAPVTDLEYLRNDARGYTHYDLRDEQIGRGPHIEAGSPLRHAAKFQSPVALFHGTLDVNVDVRHSRAMADKLEDADKSVSYTEYDGLQHGLSDSNVRTDMLKKIDAFLANALGN